MQGILNLLKKKLSWKNLDPSSLLTYYRYMSLFVTSIFYLISAPAAPFYFKAGAVFCLVLEAYLFVRIYSKSSSEWLKRLLVLVETVGLALILILTGGLDSPFVWYAINPILLSATLLPAYYCWLMAAIFLSSAIFLQPYSFYVSEVALPLWPDRSFFFTVFILSTFAAQIFTHIVARLSRQAEVMEKQLRHIKALYEAIEVFSHHSDPHEIANIFASYSRTLTGAKKVIVWLEAQFGAKDPLKKNFYVVRGPRDVLAEEHWYPYIKPIFESRQDGSEIDIYRLAAGKDKARGVLITVKVRSSSNAFGVLSAYYPNELEDIEGVKQTLTFMADLCAASLDKRLLESLAEEFLLIEERDRIAGEIHDNVTQNIFGLIYGLGMLIKKENLSKHVRNQLRLMQKTAQKALKDLRYSICRLSSLKSEKEAFIDGVEKYLLDLGQLNGVEIDFNPNGDFTSLNSQVKKALYRVVREATGNAIRHGRCDDIKISITVDGRKSSLVVADNGIGFDLDAVEHGARHGLGIVNMRELARNMGGKLTIDSRPGEGTVVSCMIPLFSRKGITAGKEKQNP
ncbi:MAG: sensor histidine kinase [Firmicutes bacterium]|nr:sensor histidine kinase [Bacillota bacterium]